MFETLIFPTLWEQETTWISKFIGKKGESDAVLVGPATVFVAYVWDQPVMTLINWALEYAKKHAGSFFWIDLFNAQVRAMHKNTMHASGLLIASISSDIIPQTNISSQFPAPWWNEAFSDKVFDGPSGIKYAEYPWNSDRGDNLPEELIKYLPPV